MKSPKAKKISKTIEDTKLRQDQLVRSFEIDINSINNQINHQHFEIGVKIFKNYDKFDEYIPKTFITENIDIILKKQEELNNLNAKKEDIFNRYKEELEMLEKLLQEELSKNNAPRKSVATGRVCPKCNNCVGDEDVFCTNCGYKFEN